MICARASFVNTFLRSYSHGQGESKARINEGERGSMAKHKERERRLMSGSSGKTHGRIQTTVETRETRRNEASPSHRLMKYNVIADGRLGF